MKVRFTELFPFGCIFCGGSSLLQSSETEHCYPRNTRHFAGYLLARPKLSSRSQTEVIFMLWSRIDALI